MFENLRMRFAINLSALLSTVGLISNSHEYPTYLLLLKFSLILMSKCAGINLRRSYFFVQGWVRLNMFWYLEKIPLWPTKNTIMTNKKYHYDQKNTIMTKQQSKILEHRHRRVQKLSINQTTPGGTNVLDTLQLGHHFQNHMSATQTKCSQPFALKRPTVEVRLFLRCGFLALLKSSHCYWV